MTFLFGFESCGNTIDSVAFLGSHTTNFKKPVIMLSKWPVKKKMENTNIPVKLCTRYTVLGDPSLGV